jgi:hypothetical protein
LKVSATFNSETIMGKRSTPSAELFSKQSSEQQKAVVKS